MISIRRASEQDTRALAFVGSATFLETYAEIVNGPAMIKHCEDTHSTQAYANYMADGGRVWIAETDETRAPVGYVLNTEPDLPVNILPGDVELRRIYLLSRYQGTGLGKALLAESIQDARSQDAPRLLLGVYSKNKTALKFYARNGFEEIGRRPFVVGGVLYDDYVLALSLN